MSKGKTCEDRSGEHVFYFVEIDGKEYRATKISHSARGQISKRVLGAISHQMRLTNRELRQFVDCTIDREEWLGLWCQRSASRRTG